MIPVDSLKKNPASSASGPDGSEKTMFQLAWRSVSAKKSMNRISAALAWQNKQEIKARLALIEFRTPELPMFNPKAQKKSQL